MASNMTLAAPLAQSLKQPTRSAPTRSAPVASSKKMAQPVGDVPNGLISCFTKSQFALALAIQRSKPAELSLRKNIQKHRLTATGACRYIDTCEFWKDQYMKLYKEKQQLEDKLSIMEEMKQAQASSTISDADNTTTLNANGKRPDLFDGMEEIFDKPSEESPPGDTSVLRLCRYVLQIGQRRVHLEKDLKDSDSTDYLDTLVNSSNQVLKLLEAALSECVAPLWAVKRSDDTRIVHLVQQLMQQVVLGFQSCLNALNQVCRTIIGRAKRLGIVYRLATLFHKALDYLHKLCTLQAENENTEKRKTRKKQRTPDDEYVVNKYLSQALVSIAQSEWKVGSPGHSDILEGLLFSILSHTGRLVSYAVFNEHVAMSDKVGHITGGKTDTINPGAQIEARYFIPILREAIGASATRRELISRVLCGRRPDSKNQSQIINSLVQESPGQELLTKARKRLQDTLVKSAMGGDEFDTLVMPEQPDNHDDAFELSGEVEKYSREWLLESAWAIVGWELAV